MNRSRREWLRGAASCMAGLTVSWGDVFASVDAAGEPVQGYGPLRADPDRVLDLPAGFSYRIISQAGDAMDDGLRVPGLADGMHAFAVGADTVLLRNHELNVGARDHAFSALTQIPRAMLAKCYDPQVGAGGTTTLILEGAGRSVRRQFLSLAGTLRNCAGGATPWGTWLSCEESVVVRGEHGALRDHGYVFEVPANGRGLTTAHALRAMGRFHREAVAVDPDTGLVYQSEDRPDGLFYRFIPVRDGQLAAGGRLQALRIEGYAGRGTGNAPGPDARVPARVELPVSWVDLDDVEAPQDNLRMRGQALGATSFVRGEGLAVQRDARGICIWFVCTEGGTAGLGQIWRYRPSPTPRGDTSRSATSAGSGTMELFLEPATAAMMRHGDNLAMAPNNDVLVCEDQPGVQRLLGVTGSAGVYVLARNPRGDSELAGACFAPGRSGRDAVLYLNIQSRGQTLAVTGPWASRSARPQA